MTAVAPRRHRSHGWVVDVATHRVVRGSCAECLPVSAKTSPATDEHALLESLSPAV